MKRLLVVLLILLPALADLPPLGVLEPQDLGAVFLLKGSTNNELVPLEARRAVYENNMGFFDGSEELKIREGRSPIRFVVGEQLQFVVRTTMPENDPRWGSFSAHDPKLYNLFKLDPGRTERRLILSETGLGGSNSAPGAYLVRVRPYGQSSFLLLPSEALTPGEYAFRYGVGSDSLDLFAFGVDPGK